MAANVRGTTTVAQRLSLVETARSLLTALPDRGDLIPGDTRGEMGGDRWRIDVLPFDADFVDPTVHFRMSLDRYINNAPRQST